MSNLSPVLAADKGRRAQYQASLSVLNHSFQLAWVSKFLRCAALYNIHSRDLHLEEYSDHAKPWEAFCQAIHTDPGTASRHIVIGKLIHEFSVKKLGNSVDSLITEQVIKSGFAPYFSNTKNISVRDLADNCANLHTFVSSLEDLGKPMLEGKELTRLLALHKSNIDELPPLKPVAGDDLFTTYNNMKAKGYLWNKELRRFTNPDGTDLTLEQYGECVVEEDAFKIFGEMNTVAQQMKDRAILMRETYGKFYKAYRFAHKSPVVHQKATDAYNELLLEIKELQRLSLEFYFDDEEDND